MASLVERALTFEKQDVTVVLCKGRVYFRASHVAEALGYADTDQAVRKNVRSHHVKTLRQLHEEACGDISSNLSNRQNV